MGKLLVYSASAGSGKTHSIAGQYILMLFSKPKAWRNILAVTFTNKACEEMKSRIIDELAAIITDKPGNRIAEISEHTKLSTQQVKIRANQIFTEMLHDYSFFSVSTIDSFYQKILRNFTRETGIQYNYEIELDTESVINISVDNLLESSNTNPELKKNIISLVEQKMDNASKWDFRKDLKTFLKRVIESDYRSYENKYNEFFNDQKKVVEFKKSLAKIENDFKSAIKKYCDEIKQVLDRYALTADDFSGKGRSIANKMLKTYLILTDNKDFEIEEYFDKVENPEKWLTKAQISTEPYKSATNELITICLKMKEYFDKNYFHFATANIIKKHFNYATLINDGLQTVHQYLNDEGKFLISEVPVFLSEIARNNSSSFIYEKTGSFYENYLIDEFQDTSNMQWNSFFPLLHESLSSGTEEEVNILVGDVKQSIYAWRGGDWRLLAYKVKEMLGNYFEPHFLDENWRSGETIVNFNNNFFSFAAVALSENIKSTYPKSLAPTTADLITSSIYDNITQKFKKDFQSVVSLSLFKQSEDKSPERKAGYLAVLKMIKQIEKLQEMNYKPGDIMILVRQNKDGSEIAQQIIQYSQSSEAKPGIIYDVISSDALFVSSNKAIQLIISCFRYLNDLNNRLAFTEAAYIYYVQTKLSTNEEIVFNKEKFVAYLDQTLEPLMIGFKQKLLHDLTDIIIDTLDLNKNPENIPFLNSFRDIVHDFGLKHPAEIGSFLEYWDETGVNQNLKIPEKQNAINIISIHKAKGLAADFVFIPFCDWSLSKPGDMFWASVDKAPFDTLPVWPVNFDGRLANSYFSDDFYYYKFRQTVEAFNMMYVAFTRARKGLFISAPDKTDNKFNNISTILKTVISNPEFAELTKPDITQYDDFGCTDYVLGQINDIAKTEESDGYLTSYPVFIPEKQIKIKSYFDRDKVDASSKSLIHKGIVYHHIFEQINTTDDIEKAIKELLVTGQIRIEDIDSITDEIRSITSAEFVYSWFDGTYKINNEAEIISDKHSIKRPDRIMESENEIIIVDYKFGFAENTKYVKQTKEYANLLSSMGYKNIKTYIWYVLSGYMIKVDLNSELTEKIIL